MKYKSIIISDLHLGTKGSRCRKITKFIKDNKFDKIILNGDIIDGWQLKKRGKWKKKHSNFFKVLFKKLKDTEIIYIKGNHDDFLTDFFPLNFDNFTLLNEYTYETISGKYFITHGDMFDYITHKLKFLAILGDIGYTLLLKYNRWYNYKRLKNGQPYKSLSKIIKSRVKKAVSFITNFENEAVKYAKNNNYDGIIMGHIHTPSNQMIDGIHYMNSGDWVESLSMILEHKDGTWEIIENYD